MTTLKPGFVPKGWERGEEVIISKATPRTLGYVTQAPRCVPPDGSAIDPEHVFAIRFHYGDEGHINEWLKWWRS